MWKEIRKALRKGECISISVPIACGTAEVKTVEGGPPWDKDMLVQFRVHKRGMDWLQIFDSIADAKEALDNEQPQI